MSFLNKVALVTGGSSGIGAAIAVKLSAAYAKVAIVGRNQTKLDAVAKLCEIKNTKQLVIIADVTKEDNVKNIVDETLKRYGKLDVLINNAGIGEINRSILSSNAVQDFDKVMTTNMRSVVNLTNLLAPHLIETKGNIINISSVSALMPARATGFAYNASKAALDHFTRTIAAELASKGVRVNSINPGPVRTDIAINASFVGEQEDAFWQIAKNSTALKRISEPEEIADLVMFLASDKAKGITGSSFLVDNGVALRVKQ